MGTCYDIPNSHWKLRRHLSEFLTAFGYGGPGLGTIAIQMHFRIHPACVVESASFYEPEIRHNSNIRDNRRSAFRTEASIDGLTAVTGIVERF